MNNNTPNPNYDLPSQRKTRQLVKMNYHNDNFEVPAQDKEELANL